MKANYSKLTAPTKLIEQSNQEVLQREEILFAEKYGINPREVVYKPFSRNEAFDIILDHTVNTFYPLNKDEFDNIEDFRDKVRIVYESEIQTQLDLIEKQYNGSFFRSRSDKVFIYSNNITDLLNTKYTLKHETFHAGLYDLIRGKIPKLRYYNDKHFTQDFMINLITENRMQTLVHNRNNSVLSPIGDQNTLFHNYSYEENFVICNAIYSMLEEEISLPKFNIHNILRILGIYITDSGYLSKQATDNLSISVYNKIIPLKSYLPTYLQILRSPFEKFDEDDKAIAASVETFPTTPYIFEEIESPIPELFEELLSLLLQGRSEQQLSAVINRFKSNEKNKSLSHKPTSHKNNIINND